MRSFHSPLASASNEADTGFLEQVSGNNLRLGTGKFLWLKLQFGSQARRSLHR